MTTVLVHHGVTECLSRTSPHRITLTIGMHLVMLCFCLQFVCSGGSRISSWGEGGGGGGKLIGGRVGMDALHALMLKMNCFK